MKSSTCVADHVRSAHPHVRVDDDVALLRKLVLGLRAEVMGQPQPRWALVVKALGNGSQVSAAICRSLNLDPDELVPPEETPDWLDEMLDPELHEDME